MNHFLISESGVFMGISRLDDSTLKIPDCVSVIGSKAIANNDKIQKIIIPASVKSLSSYSICNLNNLTEIYNKNIFFVEIVNKKISLILQTKK